MTSHCEGCSLTVASLPLMAHDLGPTVYSMASEPVKHKSLLKGNNRLNGYRDMLLCWVLSVLLYKVMSKDCVIPLCKTITGMF